MTERERELEPGRGGVRGRLLAATVALCAGVAAVLIAVLLVKGVLA